MPGRRNVPDCRSLGAQRATQMLAPRLRVSHGNHAPDACSYGRRVDVAHVQAESLYEVVAITVAEFRDDRMVPSPGLMPCLFISIEAVREKRSAEMLANA